MGHNRDASHEHPIGVAWILGTVAQPQEAQREVQTAGRTDMDSKRAEILSAMQSVADDIRPVSAGSTSSPPGVTVDIGGINVRQIASSKTGRGSQKQGPATPVGPTPDERRRDCQRRSMLRLLGVFLLFSAILPLYIVDILPDQIDYIALLIGFVSLVGSMACFAVTTVYENA